MNILKLLILCCIMAIFSCTQSDTWITDMDDAYKISIESEKPLFMKFVGSDWCKFCMLSESYLFSDKEFQKLAKKELVLFVADKTKDPKIRTENIDKYMKMYGIKGFPTFIILNSQGKELSRKSGFDVKFDYMKWIKSTIKE